MTVHRRKFLVKGLALLGAIPLTYTVLKQKNALAASNLLIYLNTEDLMASSENFTQTYPIQKSDVEWQSDLTPEAYAVLRKHSTERAGTSPLDKQYDPGVYRCAGCQQPVFSSETKFNSGTGWPSFYDPMPDSLGTTVDRTLFMTRTEVHCRQCGGHLGHVFKDGPKPTGLRYCINGVALNFEAGAST